MKLTIFLVSALVFVGLAGCGRQEPAHVEPADEHAKEEPGHTEDIVLSAEAAKIAEIEVGDARMMPMQGELKVPGSITNTAQGRAVVTPPVGGKIIRLHVKAGDRVRAGQAVATLQSADLADAAARIIEAQASVISAQAAAREARSQIDLANSKLRTAQQTLRRQQEFVKTGAFSQPALQAAQKDMADAEAELERGKQDQAVHQAQLERAERLYKQELISRTELEQARLEVATDKIRQRNAERSIELARATFEREQRIATQNLANAREIQAAEAEVRAANLDVQQAKIRHQSAVSGVASANKGVQAARAAYSAQAGAGRASGGTVTVAAPIGGVVTDVEATLGQAVERATEICEIENLRSVWVTASVSEKQIALARRGAQAQVAVSAYPNRIFPGVVQVVGSRLDPKTRTMPVQVLVDNATGELRTGMFATVGLGVGASSSALAIPRSAIVEDGDKKLIYIAEEGGRYEQKAVELGRVQGEFVEIVSGLEPGARVVVKGAFVLKSEKVKAELKGHEH
jgi:cobalt-zinc-cadmium efflux system membrane fusion protein